MSKFLYLLVFFLTPTFGKSLDYTQLQMKELDQMRAQVQTFVKKASSQVEKEEISQASESYRNAMKLILSRPNKDNMITLLLPEIRRPMRDLDLWEDTLMSLTQEAIFALTKGKEKVRLKTTNWFLLQNILSEFKPVYGKKEYVKKIFTKIRDAKIQIPRKVRSELLLRGMIESPKSPSSIAKDIIGTK